MQRISDKFRRRNEEETRKRHSYIGNWWGVRRTRPERTGPLEKGEEFRVL